MAVGFEEPFYMQQSTRMILQQSKCQTVHKTKTIFELKFCILHMCMFGKKFIYTIYIYVRNYINSEYFCRMKHLLYN